MENLKCGSVKVAASQNSSIYLDASGSKHNNHFLKHTFKNTEIKVYIYFLSEWHMCHTDKISFSYYMRCNNSTIRR